MNKKTQIEGIKMIARRNYNVPCDLLDLESRVDSKLTYPENFAAIKPYILLLSRKK